jgi:hypothetical protein
MKSTYKYPDAVAPEQVGEYAALAKAGGGYVWDAVLEYRVWCHPENGALDHADGGDYFYSFVTYEEALDFSQQTSGADEPLALVLQEEYIDEPDNADYRHMKERRVTEWPVVFLLRPKRTSETIPKFLAADAPANRLDILRGEVSHQDSDGIKKDV